MIRVSVAGGSQPEILELVKQAKEKHPNKLEFFIFDKDKDIGDESLWHYVKCDNDEDSARKAVELVANKEADILLKGIIQTHTLLKEVLQKEHGLKTKKILSHVAMVDLPERSFLLTDCGMNIAPNDESMIEIVDNVKEVAQKIGIEHPKIALLSSAETFNPKMPSSVLTTNVYNHFKSHEDVTVFGPISFDLAMSQEAVRHKRFNGAIAGDADVLVVPNIDAGNILYKSLTIFADAKVGGLIVGTKIPVVLTSRSDSTQSKLHSLEFALKQI